MRRRTESAHSAADQMGVLVDARVPGHEQIRSSSTDDVACWFIDIDYNSEAFVVRHAYFSGNNGPCEKLKRALRAEIDERHGVAA